MVNKIKIYRNNEFMYIPIEDWFEEHYKTIPKESERTFEIISKIFNINKLDDYERIYNYLWIHFNYHQILLKYKELLKLKLPFDDDIIKFISFLYGTNYFIKVGNPDIDLWINSKDINHPFKETQDAKEGFSLIEAINFKFGQNAVRKRLLSSLKLIGSQGGS